MELTDHLLRVEGLVTEFTIHGKSVRAVDGVNLTVPRGKTVCVVGESGCGKSVMARSVMGLIDQPGRVSGGSAWWRGSVPSEFHPGSAAADQEIDLLALDPRGEDMRRMRGPAISMVFQEPMASLSPMYTIGDHLVETIRTHMDMNKREARDLGTEMLRKVGIPKPETRMGNYPFQLSGGLCQRAMIAMALACSPQLLIADEPTTALDVTTQARILDLLRGLQSESDMSMLFITHDLGVVAEVADEVVVMYLGNVVEQGSVFDIFENPTHPYTQGLLRSVPRLGGGRKSALATIPGRVPHLAARPKGCAFHPRCDVAVPGVCDRKRPPVVELSDQRRAMCVLAENPAVGDDSPVDPAETTSKGE